VKLHHHAKPSKSSRGVKGVAVATAALMALLAVAPVAVQADEIKSLTATVIEIILKQIGPEFERTTGHSIKMTVDLAPNFKRQIDGGETFDVALFSALTLDLLVKEGGIKADTRTPILSAGIGVAVRRGAAKPDIGSVEAFYEQGHWLPALKAACAHLGLAIPAPPHR
jgi:molybdate transport system substrate-binding protein